MRAGHAGRPPTVVGVVGRGLLYFALVFGAGFLLGPIRVLWLAPRVGERSAELIEAPLMLAAIALAARWIARRWTAGWSAPPVLALGACGAAAVLVADLAVGLGLRGMSAAQIFMDRDPVAGTVYYLLIALMALAPLAWRWAWSAKRVP